MELFGKLEQKHGCHHPIVDNHDHFKNNTPCDLLQKLEIKAPCKRYRVTSFFCSHHTIRNCNCFISDWYRQMTVCCAGVGRYFSTLIPLFVGHCVAVLRFKSGVARPGQFISLFYPTFVWQISKACQVKVEQKLGEVFKWFWDPSWEQRKSRVEGGQKWDPIQIWFYNPLHF